jgi:hypothetical protein
MNFLVYEKLDSREVPKAQPAVKSLEPIHQVKSDANGTPNKMKVLFPECSELDLYRL